VWKDSTVQDREKECCTALESNTDRKKQKGGLREAYERDEREDGLAEHRRYNIFDLPDPRSIFDRFVNTYGYAVGVVWNRYLLQENPRYYRYGDAEAGQSD
jgi:hypothetical protein